MLPAMSKPVTTPPELVTTTSMQFSQAWNIAWFVTAMCVGCGVLKAKLLGVAPMKLPFR